MTGLTSPEHAGLEKLFTNKKQIEWFAVHMEVFMLSSERYMMMLKPFFVSICFVCRLLYG
jgi:hypothetical protein